MGTSLWESGSACGGFAYRWGDRLGEMLCHTNGLKQKKFNRLNNQHCDCVLPAGAGTFPVVTELVTRMKTLPWREKHAYYLRFCGPYLLHVTFQSIHTDLCELVGSGLACSYIDRPQDKYFFFAWRISLSAHFTLPSCVFVVTYAEKTAILQQHIEMCLQPEVKILHKLRSSLY